MPEPASRLEIRVLGPLEVLVDGGPLVVDTRKALAILVLLAVEGRAFARDELAALLWPESDDESARGALRRTLSVLRSALGGRWLEVDRSRLVLASPGTWLDLRGLEAAARSDDPSLLAAAADLARGPFLAGFSLRDSPEFDDWRATRASAVERTVADVLDRFAAVAEATGDVRSALGAAARRVELDPLDEPAHRRLMGLLARAGDRAGAIHQYRACVAVLERELGVAPLAETTGLYEAIRDARPDAIPMAAITREALARRAATPPPPHVPVDATIPPRMPIAAGGTSPRASAPLAPPGAGQAPARLPLVGREGELSAVLAAHRSAAPDGRIVAVVGEAGIGKTRLVEAVEEAVVRAGGHPLIARAFATETGIAYGSIVELLRSGLARPGAAERLRELGPVVLGELGRLIVLPDDLARGMPGPVPVEGSTDLAAAKARLLGIVADALVALSSGPVPGLVAIEDVQWADDASREALGYLARRLAGRSILLLQTWRPEDLDHRGLEFAAAVEGLPGSTVIPLGRLGRDAIAHLVAAAASTGLPALDPGTLLDESEGLPLYVVEALAAGSGGAGGSARSVRALIRERLAGISETAAQVLSAAAVIGRSFDLPTVRLTSGRSEDETLSALEELVRRGIVRELAAGGPDRFDFAHAKLRDAAYDGTSLARRRLLHRRTAEALRAAPGGRDRDDAARLALVAHHERVAGRDAEAAEAFREAGVRARAVYANHEALAHLETALALGHPDPIGLQVEIGELRTALGDYAGAIAALEAAAALADAAPPTAEWTPIDQTAPALGGVQGVHAVQLAGIELRLGRVHARRGDLVTAASHLDAALDLANSMGAAGEGGPSHARRAGSGPLAARRGAPRGTEPGLPSPALHVPRLAARILIERSVVAVREDDLGRAIAAAREALDRAQAVADVAAAGAAHRVLGLAARARGDLPTARDALLRSLDLAAADPDPGAAIAAGNALALVEAAAGDRAAAIGRLETALALCQRTGERHLEAAVENNLADQLHAVGRADEAMAHLKRAVALFADVGGRPGELEPEIWKLVAW